MEALGRWSYELYKFILNMTKEYMYKNTGYQHHDPCENCPNNPKNNPYASGVCFCSLASQYVRY